MDSSNDASLPLGGHMQAAVLVDDVWHPAVMGDCRCHDRTWQCWMVYVDRTGEVPIARAGWHDANHIRIETRP